MNAENDIIDSLQSEGNLRVLNDVETLGTDLVCGDKRYVNFSSNDYLGLSRRLDLQIEFLDSIGRNSFLMSGCSSRLMCGNRLEYRDLETYVADLYRVEACLVLGSGYLLNSSLLRAVTSSEDVILADKLIHASFIDGLKLAQCKWERFKHNDLVDLEKLLIKYDSRRVFVVVESVYSMDGDVVEATKLLELKKKYGFVLIADEAHAFGIFGDGGRGVFDVGDDVDYRIVTLGKAGASTGAFVVCSKLRQALLVNRLKSVIFSTALPPINLLWTKFIIGKMLQMDAQREHLWMLINRIGGMSQIIPVSCPGNEKVLALVSKLKDNGLWVSAIRHPTVAKGSERVRISLSSDLKIENVENLCKLIGL